MHVLFVELAMNIAILSVKGQIVIPKHMRQTARLSVGDEFVISYVNGEIRLRPLASKKKIALDQVAGCLARPKQALVSDAAIKTIIKKRLKLKHTA
jgi:AbrB family looped-hinge helix DNA binding protein